MKKIVIEDVNCNKSVYIRPDEEVDIFIEEGLRDDLWGIIEDLTFSVSEYDPEEEPQGAIISEESPRNPTNYMLWLKKSSGILYYWKESAGKWLSTDRAGFVPIENLHSEG